MLKVILCNVTKKPFCLVDVDKKTQAVKLAGAYTASGQAVNVSVNKLTASKRVMNSRDDANLIKACYHDKSDTFYLA